MSNRALPLLLFSLSSRSATISTRQSHLGCVCNLLRQSTSRAKSNKLQHAALLHATPVVATIRRVRTPGYGQIAQDPLTLEQAEERVLKAIRAWDRFPQDRADKLTLDARFVEDMGFDSLDVVEITMAVEDEFGWDVPDEVAHKFKTPRDVVAFVSDKEMVGNDEGL